MARTRPPATAGARDPYVDVKRSIFGPAVYYVLREPVRREEFLRASAILRSKAESCAGADPEAHWEHLPSFDGPILTPEDGVRFRAGWHSVTNIAAVRGYATYRIDGLECTLDYSIRRTRSACCIVRSATFRFGRVDEWSDGRVLVLAGGRVASHRHRRRMDKPRQLRPSDQAPSRS